MPRTEDDGIVIDKNTAATYQALQQLHDSLYRDPTHGMEFKKLLKKFNPKFSIPEIDAAAPHVESLEALRKELKELKEGLGNEKLESRFDREMKAAAEEFSFTSEGVEKMRKLIKETNEKDGYVLSPRAAAAMIAHDTPKPIAPTGFASNRWDMFASDDKAEQDDINSLIKDPDAWLDRQIPKILNEERAKTQPVRTF